MDERLDFLEQCCHRIGNLVRKEAWCEFSIKMEKGRITIWSVTMKEKPNGKKEEVQA